MMLERNNINKNFLEGVLRVTSPFHTLFNPPKREIEGGDEYVSADVVFILTKGHSTRSAARTAATIIGPGSLVVTLQNGMGHAERIRVLIFNPFSLAIALLLGKLTTSGLYNRLLAVFAWLNS